jgi:hypothetical protein
MSLWIFIIGVIGITHIIVESKLLKPVREWIKPRFPKLYELLTCYQCSGFWVGLICGIPYYTLCWQLIFWLFLFGGMGSILSVIAATVLDRIQRP